MTNSYKTAISRKFLSAPMSWLYKHFVFENPRLDYGCGKGTDADIIGMDKYDPHFFPQITRSKLARYKYNIITCIYVLNTIPDSFARMQVITNVKKLLRQYGTAYFAIRAENQCPNSYTKIGTWQGYHIEELEFLNAERIYQDKRFEIWKLKRFQKKK